MKPQKKVLKSGNYNVIVLDELNIALHYHLVKTEEVLSLLDALTEETELVITGRYAPETLLNKADLVTEMKEIKHYYKQDAKARKGIEF
jgi:cob(I)alamin adenosyltransferase